jgi:hypothetical protein
VTLQSLKADINSAFQKLLLGFIEACLKLFIKSAGWQEADMRCAYMGYSEADVHS